MSDVRLDFEGVEAEAQEKLMDVMEIIIKDMGLLYNHDELARARAIHTIQLFIWQHALQRTGAACWEWFDNV